MRIVRADQFIIDEVSVLVLGSEAQSHLLVLRIYICKDLSNREASLHRFLNVRLNIHSRLRKSTK